MNIFSNMGLKFLFWLLHFIIFLFFSIWFTKKIALTAAGMIFFKILFLK